MQHLPLPIVLIALLAIASPVSATDESPCGLPLLYQSDFEQGADAWEPTDAEAWRVLRLEDGNHVYNQFKMSQYQPPHRSPHNIAWLKDVVVGDFVLTAKVLSTNKTAGAHRDMCVFFGGKDPAHFYYVHLGAQPDPASSQIMIVNDAPRRPITDNPEHAGVPWTDDWHDVKVVRRVEEGRIEIYFDDMEKPLMTATDKTFQAGRIGLGSFDDHGYWDDIQLYGAKVEAAESE